jgi:hypothetical protein
MASLTVQLGTAIAFDAGMTYTDYTMPTGAGYTDGSDAASAVNARIAEQGNGASATSHVRIIFPAGYTYTLGSSILLAGLAHVTFEGQGTEVAYGHTGGATLKLTGDPRPVGEGGDGTASAGFRSAAGAAAASEDVRFHGLTIEGSSTDYATTAAGDGGEYQGSWMFYGASGVWIDHCIADKCKGDFVYLSDLASGSGTWCSDVHVSHSTCSNNGRMGLGIIAADGVLVEHCRFTDICYAPFDMEPNYTGQGWNDLEFSRNLIDGTYFSWGHDYEDGAFTTAHVDVTGTPMTGYLRIIDNVITAAMEPTNLSQWIGHFRLYNPSGVDKTATLTITGNTCTAAKAGYICLIGGFSSGGVVTDNTGFLTTGTWYSDQGSNGSITMSGNT